MIILHIFLALVWAVLAVGTLVGGLTLAYQHALAADEAETPLLQALGGVIWRILVTLAAVAIIVGVPLLLAGF